MMTSLARFSFRPGRRATDALSMTPLREKRTLGVVNSADLDAFQIVLPAMEPRIRATGTL